MDPAVEALKRLIGESVERRQQVADAINFSEQTLYQVANGIKLKSGKVRGVGRKMREALDLRFPGWMDAAGPAPTVAQQVPLSVALDSLGHYLAAEMDRDTRAELCDAMAAWARWSGKESYRDVVAGLLAPKKPKPAAAPPSGGKAPPSPNIAAHQSKFKLQGIKPEASDPAQTPPAVVPRES